MDYGPDASVPAQALIEALWLLYVSAGGDEGRDERERFLSSVGCAYWMTLREVQKQAEDLEWWINYDLQEDSERAT